MILSLALLLGSFGALGSTVCPLYYCGQVEPNNCVNIRDGNVTLANAPCSSDQYCTFAGANAWIEATLAAQSSSLSYNALYPCTTGTFTLASTDPNDLSCPSRPLLKDLQSGTDPKECSQLGNSSPECQLVDSTFDICACGIDGKAYCVPNIGSSVYDTYWEECTKTSYKGTLGSEDHWRYWTLRFQYYIPYMTGYSCTHRLFSEFILMDSLVYTNGAAALVLSLVVA